MTTFPADPIDEVGQLRQAMNGLAALAALRAIWVRRDADYVRETLLDALLSALKSDFVCASLQGPKPK